MQKADFSNPAHIKMLLLSEGLRLGDNFFSHFTDEYQGSPYHYSKDNVFTQNYPHHMILNQKTVCALNLDENSGWLLNANDDGFYLSYKNEKITGVSFPKKYPFLQAKLNDDIIAEDVGFMTTPNSMNVFIGKGCYFFHTNQPCKFCGFQHTRSIMQDKEHVTTQTVRDLILKMNEFENEVNQIYFVGATVGDFDKGFTQIIDLVRAAKEVAPDNLDLIVTSFPPKNMQLIEKLKEAGASRLSFALEAATQEVFEELAPGKSKTYGHHRFIEALLKATDSFHRQTYVSMIQGLDTKHDLIEFMWKMIDCKIMPTMNVYYHSPYSQLKDSKPRPTFDYLYDVSKEHQKIFAKSNIRLFSYGADRHCMDWEAFRQMI